MIKHYLYHIGLCRPVTHNLSRSDSLSGHPENLIVLVIKVSMKDTNSYSQNSSLPYVCPCDFDFKTH